MKKIIALSLACAMMLSLSACKDTSKELSDYGNTSAEVTETMAETTKTPETPEEFHRAMVDRSFVSFGNTYRVEQKLTKMRSGEKTTIAYIGGSITEGYNAGTDQFYARSSYEMIANRYGTGENVEYVNAGLSGTPSVLGTLRVGRDVLAYEPDIVFIEFAVNDATDTVHKESYESLIRTVLSYKSEPAVFLLFTVLESGYTAQDHMKQLGEYYELPMISVADALKPEFDEGRMVWHDYSNDGSHPHETGHALITEFIENYFIQLEARSAVPADYTMKPVAKFGRAYENSVMIDNNYDNTNPDFNISQIGCFSANSQQMRLFMNGWANDKSGNGEGFKFTVKANCVSLIYRRNKNAGLGKADVYMNGEKLTTINADDNDGWGDPYTAQLIKWQSVKEMEFEVKMADGSEELPFEILGIAYSQNETFM